MKRFGILLLVLALMMSCLSVAGAAGKEIYVSSFIAGTDGWYARGAQRVFRTTEATLRTEGRSSDWHSPGRNFDLIEGGEYTLSVEVYQDDVESANFMVSIAHSKNGGETYENLARGSAKKGEWTTLEGTYTAGDFDQFVLYVETTGAPELSYEIRNFRVDAPNGEPQRKAKEPEFVIEPVAIEDMPSIKDAYAGKFDFGAAVPQYAFGNPELKKLILKQFNILTPENELKPDSVLDVNASKKLVQETGDETAVAVHFDAAKALLTFAQENGLKVHGHVLVWHSQTPQQFFHEGYDTKKPLVSREVMLGRLENYIKEVLTQTAEMYPGVIVSWDVVNEAIDDGTAWLRKTSPWYKTIGEDFVARAFEYARKYAADGVLLYYNDYSTPYEPKLSGIIKLLEQLVAEGNIDGYGFQMHYSNGSSDVTEPPLKKIAVALEKISGLGLKLRVSELDIGASWTEKALMQQKEAYREIMKLMLQYADQTEAVQVWGLKDDMSWRMGQGVYVLLFDKNLNPKPAFYGVLEAAGE
uniref:Beta-xylanase n=1 Tax=uncultured bacterium Contigcl_1794 TaxID=1393664 RepID=W0FSY7_9BACT|nr:endo-1,4-beta-xylanase [uncultured bacterium Contigcl_1794]